MPFPDDDSATITRRHLLQSGASWAGLGALGLSQLAGSPALAKPDGKAATVLFMLSDSSTSNNKYDVITQGTGQAFHDENVLHKIDMVTRSTGPILVAYFDFASPIPSVFKLEERVPMCLLQTSDDARRFGDQIAALPRRLEGYTHTTEAIVTLYERHMHPLLQARTKIGPTNHPFAGLIGEHTQFVLDLTADDPPVYGLKTGTINTTVATQAALGERVEDPNMQAARALLQLWQVTANIIVFGGTTGKRAHPKVRLDRLEGYFRDNFVTP